MDGIIGGLGATANYIKKGISNYNRQAQVRELMERGGIQAIKDAIHSGELVGGAKKGLDTKPKKPKKTKKKETGKKVGRPFGTYRPQPSSAKSNISRSMDLTLQLRSIYLIV